MSKTKFIPGFENNYYANTKGEIFSIKSGRQLCGSVNKCGYKQVSLRKNKKTYKKYVHRIILQTFVGFSKNQCNHKNGVKTDNRLENLEYVTASENMKHAYNLGLNYTKGKKGSSHPASKLTEAEVKFIKQCLIPAFDDRFVADLFSVSHGCIHKIRTERTWKHVK